MKVEFLEQAYFEYQEAVDYYNLQMEGLSIKFIEEIKNTIEIIKKYPDAFTDFTKHTKKATLIKFPFNIIYSIINDTVYIIAIAHQHRKPNYWIERMK